ncbi:glycosyltransferase [Curtobacterium sp. 'Ferrero']|uniref:glycosyltransferase family protein n=1 Tax=Curtobacterium sp. 'Ferrero' TaxID=2033654 RepID=UPI001596D965|nr:glycosyltransferase [Curtobacterium sp. 'Ferrero']
MTRSDFSPALASSPVADDHRAIAAGEHTTGPRGTVRFAVSTADPDEGKGDLFVALGLARALRDAGWGVAMWPIERWAEDVPDDTTVLVSMLESFVPGRVGTGTALVAWVRNWTERWAELPWLTEFDAVWASSSAARDALAARHPGPVDVVPIGVDAELFTDGRGPDEGPRTDRAVTTVNFWGVRRRVQDVLAEVRPAEPIVWFAAGVDHVEDTEGVELRPAVPYTALPAVYRAAAFVVDDVIAPAAAYGTLNSRLYESLAAGALPVTDCALGLDELGLGEVPVFTDAAGLERALATSRADRDALVARLRAVVLERHTFAARAEQVSPLLEASVRAAARAAETRGDSRAPWLRWAAAERARLLAVEHERDLHLAGVHDINERLQASEAAAADFAAALERAASERDAIAERYETLTQSAEYRLLHRAGGVARGLRRISGRG